MDTLAESSVRFIAIASLLRQKGNVFTRWLWTIRRLSVYFSYRRFGNAPLGGDVDPATWRMIRLQVGEESIGQANVVLLRPQWWIDERLDPDGQLLSLSVPEVGIHENAKVIGLEPCPPISGGRGRVVIATFAHLAPALVALYVEGLVEPIRCTPDHPTWSHDKRAFIKAQDFEPGERLQGDKRLHRVVRVVHVAQTAPVFNLEIHGQHVYEVTELRVLVHNAPSNGAPGGRGGSSFEKMKGGNNRFHNKQFKNLADELSLSKTQRDRLHREIGKRRGEKLDIDDIRDIAEDLFGT